jgi:hypothetical protein
MNISLVHNGVSNHYRFPNHIRFSEIQNPKLQIPNKFQTPISNDQNDFVWNFVILWRFENPSLSPFSLRARGQREEMLASPFEKGG